MRQSCPVILLLLYWNSTHVHIKPWTPPVSVYVPDHVLREDWPSSHKDIFGSIVPTPASLGGYWDPPSDGRIGLKGVSKGSRTETAWYVLRCLDSFEWKVPLSWVHLLLFGHWEPERSRGKPCWPWPEWSGGQDPGQQCLRGQAPDTPPLSPGLLNRRQAGFPCPRLVIISYCFILWNYEKPWEEASFLLTAWSCFCFQGMAQEVFEPVRQRLSDEAAQYEVQCRL